MKTKEPSKTSLGTTVNGSEAPSLKKSESFDKTAFLKKHSSLDQVDVSDRFMSICESLGIPVSKSRAAHGGEQQKNRRKQ